jgi:hypothetical protein
MSAEFLVGIPPSKLRPFAKVQGWCERGRAESLTRDGVSIHYLCFAEQIEALCTAGAKVHVVGEAEIIRILKRSGAIVVR